MNHDDEYTCREASRGPATLKALFAALLAFLALTMALAPPAKAELAKSGPVDPSNGYPYWYEDANGTRLDLCLDPQDQMCLQPFEMPDPDAPVSFPDNFPAEAFWWAGDAAATVDGNGDGQAEGNARLSMAMEAAWGEQFQAVTDGKQLVFGRIRVRVDGLAIGSKYRVTHPYGVEEIVAVDGGSGTGEINLTEDLGCQVGAISECDFDEARFGRVGPFLTWDTFGQGTDPALAGPNGEPDAYVGDPNTPHTVVGSPVLDAQGNPQNYFKLDLSSGRPFTVIGSEGGLFESPVEDVSVLPIAPAERYEIVVDFSEYDVGEKIVLENRRVDPGEATREIMRFDVIRAETDPGKVPDVLCPEEYQYDDTHLPPDPDNVARRREFRFDKDGPMFTINGLTFDGDRIDANPREGDTEVWKVYNNSGGWIHPVHIHLINFKILSRNGRDPYPWERGWKDTVLVGENEEVEIMMRWPKVPVDGEPGDFTHKYVFHCHILEHEDHDMMAQVGVVENEIVLPELSVSPAPGTYRDDLAVVLTSTDPNAHVYYTTDGSDPLPSSPEYSGPIEVKESLTIRAMACDSTGLRGPVSTWEYAIAEETTGTTSIVLNPRRRALKRGQRLDLSGRLASEGRGLAGRRVELEHRPAGSRRFERVRRTETRQNGAFSFPGLRPAKSTAYRAVFEGDGSDYEGSVSASSLVTVRKPATRRKRARNKR